MKIAGIEKVMNKVRELESPETWVGWDDEKKKASVDLSYGPLAGDLELVIEFDFNSGEVDLYVEENGERVK